MAERAGLPCGPAPTAHPLGSPAVGRLGSQFDDIGQAASGPHVRDHIDIAAPGDRADASGKALDLELHPPRPRLVGEAEHAAGPEAAHGRSCGHERRHGGECQGAADGEHHQLPPAKDRSGANVAEHGHGVGRGAADEVGIDVGPRPIGQFDGGREAVATGGVRPFDDHRERGIGQRREQPPHELRDAEPDEQAAADCQHPQPHPARRLDAPVEGQRRPEDGRAGDRRPAQRLDPHPAAGLPPQRGEQRPQGCGRLRRRSEWWRRFEGGHGH